MILGEFFDVRKRPKFDDVIAHAACCVSRCVSFVDVVMFWACVCISVFLVRQLHRLLRLLPKTRTRAGHCCCGGAGGGGGVLAVAFCGMVLVV